MAHSKHLGWLLLSQSRSQRGDGRLGVLPAADLPEHIRLALVCLGTRRYESRGRGLFSGQGQDGGEGDGVGMGVRVGMGARVIGSQGWAHGQGQGTGMGSRPGPGYVGIRGGWGRLQPEIGELSAEGGAWVELEYLKGQGQG